MPTRPLRLASLLDRGPNMQPGNLIIEKTATGYSQQTYRDHMIQTKALALALSTEYVNSPRICRGERVGTFCYNTNRHFSCYHGVPLMGAVLHPINIRLGPKEIGWILQHAEDRIIIVDAVLLANLAKVEAKDLHLLRKIIVCGENDQPGGWQHTSAAAMLSSKINVDIIDFDAFVAPFLTSALSHSWDEDINEHSACGMCYTSGTTGNPKGVLYSHRSTFLHTLAMPQKDNHCLGGADVLLPVVPYFHANGWGIPYCALMLGARILHNAQFTDPEIILQMAVDWGATYSAAVPAIWQSAKERLASDLEKYRGKFVVETIICGGSAPSPEMMRWYKDEFNVSFMQGWGMTETSPMGTNSKFVTKYVHRSLTTEEQFENIKLAGGNSPGLEMKIVNSEDFTQELPKDGIAQGELLVRGPWVTESYYKIHKPNAFIGGWLATGDVASIDRGGNLIIRDRSKDVIKSGGEWISSIDLEKAIAAMKGISQVAVVAQPHPKWDERPVCVIVPQSGVIGFEMFTTEKVRAFISKDFAKYELPDEVLVWNSIPMTGTGKVDKKNIRKKLQDDGYRLPSLRNNAKL